MFSPVIPPCASPPSCLEGGTFFYSPLELDYITSSLGWTARRLLRTTVVLPSVGQWNCCEFSQTVGPIVSYTLAGRQSLPVLIHEAGHAYHVHMLRGLSLTAPIWRCEAFAYYAVLRLYDMLLRDGVGWGGFAEYVDAHTVIAPKAMGLARILMDEHPERAVQLALAGGGYVA